MCWFARRVDVSPCACVRLDFFLRDMPASLRLIAIACFRLLTIGPFFDPECKVPSLNLCISCFTPARPGLIGKWHSIIKNYWFTSIDVDSQQFRCDCPQGKTEL